MELAQKWSTYPMGPTLRRYLGIADQDYKGEHSPPPKADAVTSFSLDLQTAMQSQPVADNYEWLDLIEELTGMGLSRLVCFLAEEDYRSVADQHMEAQLAIGSAYMLEDQFEAALQYLERAHELNPNEIAPYVNITSIHYAHKRDTEAQTWARAGLQVDPNHQRLWEILASTYLANQQAAGEQIKAIAEELDSYMGLTLAAELVAPGDALLKAQYLESLMTRDELSEDYLVEYTAALGLAQQYEKIPGVIWQAERRMQGPLPWKAYAHGAQAYLSMELWDQAEAAIAKLKTNSEVPAEVIHDLTTIYQQEQNADESTPKE
jgi:tetratricopeptide (TPR) repeat protein